jgi:tRNA (guanine26-N2/guanine27-N2)-dimethyltransferase
VNGQLAIMAFIVRRGYVVASVARITKSAKRSVYSHGLGCTIRYNSTYVSSEGQTRPESVTEIIENRARVQVRGDRTFYNDAQVLNRDLSVLVINHYANVVQKEREVIHKKRMDAYEQHQIVKPQEPPRGISLLEAFSASGVRSIRYLQEICGLSHVTVNDIDPEAINTAKANFLLNGLTDTSRYSFCQQDANDLMYSLRKADNKFDVIDLDPYGTSALYMDAAIQALAPGGLLCVTNTDSRVLGGDSEAACFARYGAMPLKSNDCVHEMSIRIVMQHIDTVAARYRKFPVPWVSMSSDFFLRIFVRVFDSPSDANNAAARRCMVFAPHNYPSFYLQPMGRLEWNREASNKTSTTNDAESSKASGALKGCRSALFQIPAHCEETGLALRVAGPIYSGPLHNSTIVGNLLDYLPTEAPSDGSKGEHLILPSNSRLRSVLKCIQHEIEVPFFYDISSLFGAVKVVPVNRRLFASALINMGFKVSAFHREPGSLKTDAPNHVVLRWSEVVVRLITFRVGRFGT